MVAFVCVLVIVER